MKINTWKLIASEILNSYTYMFYIIEIPNLYLTKFHTCITYEFSHREYSNLPACRYWILNTTSTPKKVKNQIVYNYI